MVLHLKVFFRKFVYRTAIYNIEILFILYLFRVLKHDFLIFLILSNFIGETCSGNTYKIHTFEILSKYRFLLLKIIFIYPIIQTYNLLPAIKHIYWNNILAISSMLIIKGKKLQDGRFKRGTTKVRRYIFNGYIFIIRIRENSYNVNCSSWVII